MNMTRAEVNINGVKTIFSYRADSVGDNGVIQQIFVNGDYNIAHWTQGRKLIEYHEQHSRNQTSLIIDAGANIGASAVFFANSYKNSLVFAIEPDEMNWHLLSLNTTSLNCIAFKGAVSSEDGELAFIDPGRSDWGFMTAKMDPASVDGARKVKSICPSSILKHPNVATARPLIFKIDIEGGEEALFSGDTEWLNKFPLVIIELHDWMLPFSGSSRNFIRAVAKFEFDIVHKGENIFLFNRSLLA